MRKTGILFFAVLAGCFRSYGQYTEDIERTDTLKQPPMEVVLDLVPEDLDQHLYVLSWEDTLGKSKNFPKHNRPLELHCYIRDSKGLIGYYRGLSTQFTHCGFQTQDDHIDVFFSIRPNGNYHDQKGPGIAIKLRDGSPGYVSEFRKITLPVKRTSKLKVVLENNDDMVSLVYISKHALFPDPMPCKGCHEGRVMCLSRYYISNKTGKIKKLKRWIDTHSIKKIVNELDLILIEPSKEYVDLKGNKHKGSDLIKAKKVSRAQFNFDQFKEDGEGFPY